MSTWWLFAIAFLLVALGGLMAALDAAITSLPRSDIERISRSARFQKSLDAISRDTGAHLNAINFVRISFETTAAVLVTLALARLTPELWQALLLAALVMSAVSFVLVGVSPRSVGRAQAERLLRLAAPVARFVRVILGPLAGILVGLGNRVTPGRVRPGGITTERELLSVVDEATEREVLEEDDRQLIHSVFEFGDTVVREVMVPRTDMYTVPADASIDEALTLFLRFGVSRMPVLVDDIDETDRVLYLRDVAEALARRLSDDTATVPSVSELARPAILVPESMNVDELLRLMQRNSIHLAMVVDEYGGVAGLVTLEDVIEELVGDISDEYDRADQDVVELTPGRYRVNSRVAVDELGELFGLDLDDDDVDTVGGLVVKALGRLAGRGDVVEAHGLRFEIEQLGRRKRLETVVVSAADTLSARSEN